MVALGLAGVGGWLQHGLCPGDGEVPLMHTGQGGRAVPCTLCSNTDGPEGTELKDVRKPQL